MFHFHLIYCLSLALKTSNILFPLSDLPMEQYNTIDDFISEKDPKNDNEHLFLFKNI